MVSGSSTTAGNLFLAVGSAAVDCGSGFDSLAPFTTVQDSDVMSSTPFTVTDTVLNDPTLKHFGVCFQKSTGTFTDAQGNVVSVGLLHKCKETRFPPPCIKSATELGGTVTAVLLVPPSDPRFHAGGTTRVVTSVSPASAAPGKKVTIRGLFLKGAQLLIDGVAVRGKSSNSKITFTMPSGASAGVVPIVVTTATGSTVYQASTAL